MNKSISARLQPDASTSGKWNYRVVARKDFKGNLYYAIYEAHYHKKEHTRPYAIGQKATTVLAEKVIDLDNQLRHMRRAVKEPVIWGGDGPELLNEYDPKKDYPAEIFKE